MKPAVALLFCWFAQSIIVVGPPFPPNAVAGGNVVAILHLSAGTVRSVDVLSGDEPFVEPVRAALAGWRLEPSSNDDTLVVVNYRTPNLYPVGNASREVAPGALRSGLAYPKSIVEPAYPPNSLAEGSAVLKLTLSAAGGVTRANVVQGLGGLTNSCIAAARQWQFVPARNRGNAAIASEAYAVFVVRRPIL